MRRPSPSMVVAVLALFVALGGTGYAALKLPKNSVGARQLRDGAVTAAKLHSGAVTASKLGKGAVTSAGIKDGSLTSVDFAANQLPVGPRGSVGPGGPRGPVGLAGAPGAQGASGASGSSGSGATGTTGLSGARAYGVVRSDGSLVAEKSRNLTSSKLPASTGLYCVTPTAESGIDAATVQPVAMPDYNDGQGNLHIVQSILAASAGDCAGGWELRTDDIQAQTTTQQDVGFTVIVP